MVVAQTTMTMTIAHAGPFAEAVAREAVALDAVAVVAAAAL